MWDWRQFRRTIWPAVSVTGLIIAVGTHILDGISAISLGLPTWAWESIGAAIFAVALLAIVLGNIPSTDYIRRGDTVTLQKATPTQVPVKSPEKHPTITGETSIRDVTHLTFSDADNIDFHIGPESFGAIYGANRLAEMLRLNLGEMALLRRLAVAQQDGDWLRRCEMVLSTAGIQKPDWSISRLEQMGFIHVADKWITLHDAGREAVWGFSQCMAHDPKLVTAYRSVTPQIDRVIRLDGRQLRQ